MNRRTFLTVCASLAGLAAGTAPVAASRGTDGTHSRRAVTPRVYQFDLDRDGRTDVDFVSARAPRRRDGRRGTTSSRVAHATSRGDRTRDYAVSMKPLHVSLGLIAAGTALRFDYYAGERDGSAGPGDLWLYVADASRDRHLVYLPSTALRRGRRRGGTWRTIRVDEAVRGRPAVRGGHSVRWREVAGSTPLPVRNGGRRVRRPAADLVKRFGKRAAVIAVGVGVGSRDRGVVHDVYYGPVRLGGKSFGPFPADPGRATEARGPTKRRKKHGGSTDHEKSKEKHGGSKQSGSGQNESKNGHGSSSSDHGGSKGHGEAKGRGKSKGHGEAKGRGKAKGKAKGHR